MSWPRKLRNWRWAIRSSNYTVILDACVLYPAPLRDLLLELAATGLFRAKWTDQIHDEWIRNLLANRPNTRPERLARTRELMNLAVMDCLVEGYEGLIEAIELPDPGDRHVLAAAIHAGCDAIITNNLRDFPDTALAPYNIEAQHPDDFIHHQFGLDHAAVVVAAQRCLARLKNPPRTVEEYLGTLQALALPKTVAELTPYAAVLAPAGRVVH